MLSAGWPRNESTRCFSNAAASSGVKNSFPANSPGRSRGVNVAFVQYPCRSGWPSGVRLGVQVDFDSGLADGESTPAVAVARAVLGTGAAEGAWPPADSAPAMAAIAKATAGTL